MSAAHWEQKWLRFWQQFGALGPAYVTNVKLIATFVPNHQLQGDFPSLERSLKHICRVVGLGYLCIVPGVVGVACASVQLEAVVPVAPWVEQANVKTC